MSDRTDMEWVMVTPSIAAEWLGKTDIQRRVKPHVVTNYATDMREGRWGEDVNAIAFDESGFLKNGQHRLLAVIGSGVTTGFWIRRGVDEQSVLRMDQGAPRTVGDQLTFKSISNANTVGAIARTVLRYYTLPDLVWGGSSAARVTKSMCVDEVLADDDQYQLACQIAGRAWSAARVNRSSFGAFVVIAWRDSSNTDLLESYTQGIETGADLSADDPRLAFRNYWGRPDLKSWGQGQSHLITCIKAWNKYVDEEPARIFKMPRREEIKAGMPKVR